MASAVSFVSELGAVAAFASGSSIAAPVQWAASGSSSPLNMVSAFRRAGACGLRLRAMQSVSMVGRKTVTQARRLRVFAAEGSQTAEPEATVAATKGEGSEPEATVAPTVGKAAKKPHSDEGKSTLEIVREVISEQLAVKLADLEPDTKFVDLGADSLDTVEIMMSLEERFDITIEEDGTEKIGTVKDAADLIDQVKAKN